MLYSQHIDACFESRIGEHGIDKLSYQALLEKTPVIIHALKENKVNGSLPMLSLPERDDDLADIEHVAQAMRSRFKHLVVLGTGGSSLNGQALVGLKYSEDKDIPTRVHFMDTVDPHAVEHILYSLPLKDTVFLAISKSGKTLETLAQILLCIERTQKALNKKEIGDQFYIISDPGDSPLRRIGKAINASILDHEPKVGGRFSTFTNVGLLPACVAGLDIRAIRQGAAAVTKEMFEKGSGSDVAEGAAVNVAFMEKGMAANVMMAYVDRLSNFVQWYRQIWSESLGKDGKGNTPIKAMGPLDQHSQLQLYLDGPRDKFFTFITLDTKMVGSAIHLGDIVESSLSYLEGRTLGDILQAEHQATIDTMVRKQCPLRHISLDRLDEEVLGALLMHTTLETIVIAGLLDINAYDQPAVEEGKILARELLENANVVTA